MKNKYGIILLIASFVPFVSSLVIPTNAIKFINHYNFYTFSVILLILPALFVILFSCFIFRLQNERKVFPILAIIIVSLPVLAFGVLSIIWKDRMKETQTSEQVVSTRIFEIKRDNYTFKVSFQVTDPCQSASENCAEKGTINVFKDNTFLQQIKSNDLSVAFDKINQTEAKEVALYDESAPIIFDDFNFDGSKDLAIRDGNNSGYGGPSYDIYLYDKNSGVFIFNKDFTDLATNYLGMFNIDNNNKEIITLQKSGCCIHYTEKWRIVSNVLQKFYDETVQGGLFDVITQKDLVNGEWKEKTWAEIKDNFEDGTSEGYVYVNKKYNFSTVHPYNTFYLHDGSFDPNNPEKGSVDYSNSFNDPVLLSEEGIPLDIALVISATDPPWMSWQNLGNSQELRELNLKEYAKQMAQSALTPTKPVELNSDPYGKIYEVVIKGITGGPQKVQHFYFFPNFLLTFNYTNGDAEKAFASIEKIMIKYVSPGESG